MITKKWWSNWWSLNVDQIVDKVGEGRGRELLQLDEGEEGQVGGDDLDHYPGAREYDDHSSHDHKNHHNHVVLIMILRMKVMVNIPIINLHDRSASCFSAQIHFLVVRRYYLHSFSGGRRIRGATKVDHHHWRAFLKREPGRIWSNWDGHHGIESRRGRRNSISRMGNCQSCWWPWRRGSPLRSLRLNIIFIIIVISIAKRCSHSCPTQRFPTQTHPSNPSHL